MLLGSFIPSYGSLFQIIQWNLQTQEVVSYTSSEMIPIKYELIKSTWYRMISLFTTHDNNRLITYNFATCANVSAKSISSCWLFPCTTSLALIFTISFCLLRLFLKTHFIQWHYYLLILELFLKHHFTLIIVPYKIPLVFLWLPIITSSIYYFYRGFCVSYLVCLMLV